MIDKGYNEDDPRGVKIFNDLQDQEYLRRDAKIIGIGCGEGENLIVFKKNGFNDLTGLEPSLDCCRKLQKFYSIKCINKSLASYMPDFNASERFDCVILSHMLEHFVEPEKALGMINSIMKPEGVMYILGPDFYGFSKPYSQFTTPHTFYFSRTSLEMLLNNSGFTVDKYFESSAKEIALVAKNPITRLVAITNNAIEYKGVLSHLKKDNLEYIKIQLMGILLKLIMTVFHEDTYLAVRGYLRKFKILR